METGKVKFFHTEKRFGFIISPSGEEIFFHFNDGEFVIPGGSSPRFSGNAKLMIEGRLRALKDPERDDEVVFDRTQGSKGTKACPWGYQTHFDRAVSIITNRRAYRVWETMNSLGAQPGEPELLWEGTDLEELLAKYPVPKSNQSPSADPLLPYWADNDGIFEIRRWFEVQTKNGWQRCSDPRPLSGVNRQFERISRR
jgi:cold shock CspA family protein